MIAVTQGRGVGPGKTYLDKQLERGKDRVAALRLLRRRLSDVVYAALRATSRPPPRTTKWSHSRRLLDIGASRSSIATPALIDFIRANREKFGVEPICIVPSEHGCSITRRRSMGT